MLKLVSVIGFGLYGDGVSTSATFVIDKSLAPSALNMLPSGVFIQSRQIFSANSNGSDDPSYTVSATLNRNLLTVTFNKPLEAVQFPVQVSAGRADISIGCFYDVN